MGKGIKTKQSKKMEARGKLSASYQFRTREKPIYLFRGSLADEEEEKRIAERTWAIHLLLALAHPQ